MDRQFNDEGAYYIADTSAHADLDIYGILAFTDTVIASIGFKGGYLGPSADEGAVITGVTIPAGTTLFMRITDITLTSGSIFAYRGS